MAALFAVGPGSDAAAAANTSCEIQIGGDDGFLLAAQMPLPGMPPALAVWKPPVSRRELDVSLVRSGQAFDRLDAIERADVRWRLPVKSVAAKRAKYALVASGGGRRATMTAVRLGPLLDEMVAAWNVTREGPEGRALIEVFSQPGPVTVRLRRDDGVVVMTARVEAGEARRQALLARAQRIVETSDPTYCDHAPDAPAAPVSS